MSRGSTSRGRSAVKMITGVWAGSRFDLKGVEDFGGGTKGRAMTQGTTESVHSANDSGLAHPVKQLSW